MGSGDWFKTIIGLRKSKISSKKAKGSPTSEKQSVLKPNNYTGKVSSSLSNGNKGENLQLHGVSVEVIAAIRIQKAFRAYKARRSLRRLKGLAKLQILTQRHSVQKQANTTLNYLHSWSKIQAEINARRLCMVTEDRIRRKRLESQLKLEGKLHDLEVEWCGGSETMDEILARIHQREEAAVKRERAMAYAFSHQWRANCSQSHLLGNYELGNANWGWSWKERWIAARPWERRVSKTSISPKKAETKQSNKAHKDKNPSTPKTPGSVKPSPANAKGTIKTRRLSYPSMEKIVPNEEKQ
ncbi:hypothetical protein L6164_036785 [Bauhinia variegata]|uniref:Uncharacterized protein n=1 Tax=Bauhinia variegata TaxID=167791 RepID=A0ACB9KI51_BAUVA|nr:hypothetical protein L6164_036785 [Bauhinia variegata]